MNSETIPQQVHAFIYAHHIYFIYVSIYNYRHVFSIISYHRNHHSHSYHRKGFRTSLNRWAKEASLLSVGDGPVYLQWRSRVPKAHTSIGTAARRSVWAFSLRSIYQPPEFMCSERASTSR